MIKALTAGLILLASPATAEEMSPAGCNALSVSAEDASTRIGEMAAGMTKSDAFRGAMPYMPGKAKAAAADVEDARISAEMALREYTHSLDDFAKAIKDCGN